MLSRSRQMADEGKVTSAVKAVKELVEAVPVYPDAVQPAAKEFGDAAKPAGRELGEAVTTIAKTVNVALGPLRLLIWGVEEIWQLVQDRLAEEFKDKPDRLVSPNP